MPVSPLLSLLVLIGFSFAATAVLPLARGAKVTSSSAYAQFGPSNLVDGGKDDGQKSRWVSAEDDLAPWCCLEFPAEIEFNQVVLTGYLKEFAQRDLLVKVRRGDSWVAVAKVEGNQERVIELAFPLVKTSGLRIEFQKGAKDHRVRLYEIELGKSDFRVASHGLGRGIFGPAETPALTVQNLMPRPGALKWRLGTRTTQGNTETEWAPWRESLVTNEMALPWPKPARFGRARMVAELAALGGTFRGELDLGVLYVPASSAESRFSSPFGVHWKGVSGEEWRRLGIYWLRSHDCPEYYWNRIENPKGEIDWSTTRASLADTKAGGLNPVLVLEGVPPQYSTAYEAERLSYDGLEYYPPRDLVPWFTHYVEPFIRETQGFPGRVWEMWNETWSYYRWRGLRGTPGELFHFYRENYQRLKAKDPGVAVMATDTGLVKEGESIFTYRGLTDELLELGYLRFTDIANYHAYGPILPQYPAVIKKRLWAWGRDLPLWDTETGRIMGAGPLTQQALLHRFLGVERVFLYNDENGFSDFFAPDGSPTDDLAAYSAVARNLGDALPLGRIQQDGVDYYLVAAKKHLLAVLVPLAPSALRLSVDPSRALSIQDYHGNGMAAKGEIKVASNEPLYVWNPSPELLARALAAELETRFAAGAKAVAELPKLSPASASPYFAALLQYRAGLAARREGAMANSEELRVGGELLEILDNLAILQARRGESQNPPADLKALALRGGELNRMIQEKTRQNSLLLNAERLSSRASRLLDQARVLDKEGDGPGCAILSQRIASDFKAAAAYAANETPSALYRPKLAFRSLKRLLRSDIYNFIPGRAQPALICVANPYSHPLPVDLEVVLPPGWTMDLASTRATVAPLSRHNFEFTVTASAAAKKGDLVEILVKERSAVVAPHRAQAVVVDRLPPLPVLSDKKEDDLQPGN